MTSSPGTDLMPVDLMPADLMPVGSLWIGGPLSWLEIASIRSFVGLGHDYVLYTYGPVPNVPEGAVQRDAREIWDTDRILTYKKAGSPALHADIFRVMMVRQTGRVWADTDILALRPFIRDLAWYIGHEREDRVELGNAVLGLPEGSQTLAGLHDLLASASPVPPWLAPRQQQRLAGGDPGDLAWGTFGPRALTHFAAATGEIAHAQPPRVFFPVSFQDRKDLINPGMAGALTERMAAANSLCVHLYSRWLRKACARSPHGTAPRGSWLGRWLATNGMAPGDVAGDVPGDVMETVRAKPAPQATPARPGPARSKPALTPAETDLLDDLAARKARIPGGANVSPHGRVTIVTMAKDEGPCILEWVAWHHLLGFTDILVYTNDCTDGTDELLDALAAHGLVTRMENQPWKDKPPQSRALHWAGQHPLVRVSDWLLVMDFDEFVTIPATADPGLRDTDSLITGLEAAGASGLCFTWRFFGSNGLRDFGPGPVTSRMTRAAPVNFSKGFGIKTLYKANENLVMAIHRPYYNMRYARSPEGQATPLHWLNSNGDPVDGRSLRWRMSGKQGGYRLAQLNHYGVKSREEYLLRRLRGDVLDNHSKYDAAYFGLFDRNEVDDPPAPARAARLAEYMAQLRDCPDIAAACDLVETRRQARLARLRASEGYAAQIAGLAPMAFDAAQKLKRDNSAP